MISQKRNFYHLTVLLVLFFVQPSIAQLQDENLLQVLPKGYHVGFQKRQGNMQIQEFVPTGQTVENWSEMITTQIFFGMKRSPEQFYEGMKKMWTSQCAGGSTQVVASGKENGYPFILWFASCPKNAATGKPENTYFKAIAGNDSFYLVQKASKFDWDKEYITRWSHYMKKIMVCDSRIPSQRCPQASR